MEDKGARLSLKSVVLPFTTFSSLNEILVMKNNNAKQAVINQVFFTNTMLKIIEK